MTNFTEEEINIILESLKNYEIKCINSIKRHNNRLKYKEYECTKKLDKIVVKVLETDIQIMHNIMNKLS